MKSMYRAKQKESEEMIRKLEKKGERSPDCRVNWKDVYTTVSEHSALKAPKDTNPQEPAVVKSDILQLCCSI